MKTILTSIICLCFIGSLGAYGATRTPIVKKTLGVTHEQVLQWMKKDFGNVKKTVKNGKITREVVSKSGATIIQTTGNRKNLTSALMYAHTTVTPKKEALETLLFLKNLFANTDKVDAWISGIMKTNHQSKVRRTLAYTDIEGRRVRLAIDEYGEYMSITITPATHHLFNGN